MPDKQANEAFLQFMAEYTAFLAQMRTDESEKMAALVSRDLKRIEQSIARSQANAKQLENFEKKREVVQAQAGYEGLTFRQLIDVAPLENQEKLWELFAKFEGSVAEIKFYNDKAMAVARDGMIDIDSSAILPAQSAHSGKVTNPYMRQQATQHEQSSLMLEKKA